MKNEQAILGADWSWLKLSVFWQAEAYHTWDAHFQCVTQGPFLI